MSQSIIVGLDLGSAAFRLVACAPSEGGERPRPLVQVQKEARGIKKGYVVRPDEALLALRALLLEAERQSKIKIGKNVFLGVGGVGLESRTGEGQVAVARSDLEITRYDLGRAEDAAEKNLEGNNFQILHRFPLDFKLDGKKIPGRPEGLIGQRLEVKTLFVRCLNQHLQDLLQLAAQAGLEVEEVVAAPLAGALASLSTNQKMVGCALVNIGAQTTALTVFEDNLIRSIRVFPVGGNDVTNDIALGLLVSPEEAEKIKLDPEQIIGQKKQLDLVVGARMEEIFELVGTHLKKIGLAGLLPGGIVLGGGGANLFGADKIAKSTLKLPTRVLDPILVPQLKNQIRDPRFATAYGLCLFAMEETHEESLGTRMVAGAKQKIGHWFKQLLP